MKMKHVATIICVSAALVGCGKRPASIGARSASATPASASAAGSAVAAAQAGASTPTLSKVFTPDILGARVAYLETIIGPAFRVEDHDRIYKVDGCEVIAGATNGEIDNIGIVGVSQKCNFQIDQYFGHSDGDPPTPAYPTFGDIERLRGNVTFSTDCLVQCGNAADPVVSMFSMGAHVDGFNDLYVEVSTTDNVPSDAYEDWSSKIAAKYGQDYAGDDGQYKLDASVQEVAAKDFASIHPDTIRVGQNLPSSIPN